MKAYRGNNYLDKGAIHCDCCTSGRKVLLGYVDDAVLTIKRRKYGKEHIAVRHIDKNLDITSTVK